jgi:uncharacterized protein involved in exopolysaccharide biosynthesis
LAYDFLYLRTQLKTTRMSKKKDFYSFDFIEVFAFLNRWKKHLLVIVILSAIVSTIISSPLFITPKYKASALFFPSMTNAISSSLFYEEGPTKEDPLTFGDEETDEQYIQLLVSGTLTSKVIGHFNLMEHYHIDTTRADKHKALYDEYHDNVKIARTNYNSIEIEVLDKDPKMAAALANGIMLCVDTVKQEVQSNVANQIYNIVKEQYETKLAYVDSIKARMKALGIKGVYLGIKGVYGASAQLKTTNENSNLSEDGAEYIALEELLTHEVEQLADLHLRYEQAKVDKEAKLSNIFVVNYASAPEFKAYPIRSVIIVFSVFCAFIMGCVVLITIEKYHQFRNKIN